MFQTFAMESLKLNVIHRAITEIIKTIVNHIENEEEFTNWKSLIPVYAKDLLNSKRKLKECIFQLGDQIKNNLGESKKVLAWIDHHNSISALLNGSCDHNNIESLQPATKEILSAIFEEGFSLLGKTGIRDEHYKIIYKSLSSKTCPFCGYMPFDAPSKSLIREDLDHYLDRKTYFSAAANLENLVPTCTKCNSRYKGVENLIFKAGNYRKAIYPYGDFRGDICLRGTDLIGDDSLSPKWDIKLLPDIEEVRTWDEVYRVRERVRENALAPNYESTLDEMIDFFQSIGLYSSCTDEELSDAINKFYDYKCKNPEQGLGFLKHKIVDIFKYKIEQSDASILSIIRAGMRPPIHEAA